MKVGAGWVEVALARRQTMGRPEVRVVEDPPDQIRAVARRGGTGGRWFGGRGWGKVRRSEVEEG